VSPLLIALLGVYLVPLFVGTWRTSLLGLSLQGLLMAWLAYRLGPPQAPADWIALADLGLVRGLWVPLSLYGVLKAQNAPARNNVIAPNLFSWALALGLVMLAFNFAERLVPGAGEERTLVAVVAAGLMLGLLVLATEAGPFSQMVGALRVENAIALFELGGERHRPALGLQLGLILVFVLTVALYRWYLKTLPPGEAPEAAEEPPTL
jgi:hydrogenase-4 component E